MREPELVADCMAAIKGAVSVPATVKCRIGVDDQDPAVSLFATVDACDAVAQEQNPQPASSQPAMPRVNQPKSRAGLAPGEKVTAEDDGFIDDEGVEDEEDFRDEE